jgi:homocysteine S-methyltransferase
MDLSTHIARRETILTEGSVYEILRRDPRVHFDEHIAHAGLIYDEHARRLLAGIHRQYFDIAHRHNLPFLAFTDTWRASGERIAKSPFRGRNVNRDNVAFLRAVVSGAFVGALTGPRGDAYRPHEAPSFDEALRVHAFQIEQLAECGVDLLMAATLPAFPEAKAIAQLMSRSGVPWMLSFVVRAEGVLLDQSPLADVIAAIDDTTPVPPLGYSINCVHPSIAQQALSTIPAHARRRVVAFQGNTSLLSPEEIDGAPEIDTVHPRTYADAVAALRASSEVCVVGGCCGTDERHMEAVARS